MNEVYEDLLHCVDQVREKTDFKPQVALVLGSGLGEYAEEISIVQTVDYAEIEGFPVSTVAGHKGRFVFGTVSDVPVVIMQGRVHYYEGYPIEDVVLPIRLMGLLGARRLLLTNAAGGVNPDFHAGEFMLITDHILFGVPSPLRGPNLDELGPRFPDMTDLYSPRLRDIVRDAAADLKIPLHEGVYAQFSGPAYETPAEVRMCRTLGCDAVGMSTACEAVAARHMGLEVCGISCITNPAAGVSQNRLDHREVEAAAARAGQDFTRLITRVITDCGGLVTG